MKVTFLMKVYISTVSMTVLFNWFIVLKQWQSIYHQIELLEISKLIYMEIDKNYNRKSYIEMEKTRKLSDFKPQQIIIIQCSISKREKSLLRKHNTFLKLENPWYVDSLLSAQRQRWLWRRRSISRIDTNKWAKSSFIPYKIHLPWNISPNANLTL